MTGSWLFGLLGSVNVRPGPNSAEKSPLRSASVGRVCKLLDKPRRFLYCSQAKKKNVLSRPLYKWGTMTGPPSTPPKSFWRSLGLGLRAVQGLVPPQPTLLCLIFALVKSSFQLYAFNASLRNN